jgi:hypothetical protein
MDLITQAQTDTPKNAKRIDQYQKEWRRLGSEALNLHGEGDDGDSENEHAYQIAINACQVGQRYWLAIDTAILNYETNQPTTAAPSEQITDCVEEWKRLATEALKLHGEGDDDA